MKVFVLVQGMGHDGYDEPHGVYSTLELAESAQKRFNDDLKIHGAYYEGFTFEIFDFELDEVIDITWIDR